MITPPLIPDQKQTSPAAAEFALAQTIDPKSSEFIQAIDERCDAARQQLKELGALGYQVGPTLSSTSSPPPLTKIICLSQITENEDLIVICREKDRRR